MRSVLIAALVAAVAGCSNPTSPGMAGVTNLQVAKQGSAAAPPGATDPPTIRIEGRSLVVLGLMRAPSPCDPITAESTRRWGRSIAVRLTAQPHSQICVGIIGEFAYRTDTALSPGTYHVSVIHDYPGTGWPTTTVSTATVSVQ